MKLNLSKFKKVKEDQHSTTLRHPAGHEITIAHKGLSKDMHEGLKALPHFAYGGAANQGEATIKNNPNNPFVESNNPKLQESKKLPHYADGGAPAEDNSVPAPTADNSPATPETPPPPTASSVKPEKQDSEEAIMHDIANQPTSPTIEPSRSEKAGNYIADLAKGIDPNSPLGKHISGPAINAAQDFKKGLTKGDDTAQVAQAAVQAAQYPPADVPVALKPNAQPSTNENPTPSATPPNAPAAQAPYSGGPASYGGGASPGPENKPPAPFVPPNIQDSYLHKILGETGVSESLQSLAKNQAETHNNAAKEEQTSLGIFQDSVKDITNEQNKLMEDIKNQKIDPNRLFNNMSVGQQIRSVIGVIGGGISGGLLGGPNQALDYLHKLTDRDIDAQKANLGKTENLLSANFRKFGDLAQATGMTKIMQADVVGHLLASQAAAAQSPIEAARLLTMKGQIEEGMAPAFQSLAMKRALDTGAVNGTSPASWVRWVVPETRQAETFKEIERAENTSHMADSINSSFEQAVKENTALKTGFGFARTPASVYALHQAMQPTFADLEGTVRQAAMDNTFKNITPQPGDSDHTIDTKRTALKNYLTSKASAPTAKGFGIDLDKFRSTSTNPEAKLTDKQQEWVKIARANPNNPQSAIILKQLGVPANGGQ